METKFLLIRKNFHSSSQPNTLTCIYFSQMNEKVKLNKSFFTSRREPERLVSPSLRFLQHRYLHLRYLPVLAQPPEKVFSTDIIWSEIQLPKGSYQFFCGSSHEFGNSFYFVFLFLSILQFTTVKRSMGKVVLGSFKPLSEDACRCRYRYKWKWNLPSEFCYISSSLRARHETTHVDFKWR